jgi:ketosteroid isomerase-like protein
MMKKWWVVYKVNPEIHSHRYDEYMERNEEEDVYQEEIEKGKNFTVSDGSRLTELATCGIEVMEEEPGPSKNIFKNDKDLQRKVFENHNE